MAKIPVLKSEDFRKRRKLEETDVILTITGRQIQPDGTEEKHQTKHRARCKRNGDGAYEITYNERMEGIEEPLESRITVDKRRVVIERKGKLSTSLLLEKGRRNACLYETPYGAIPLETEADSIDALTVDRNIHIRVAYRLLQGSMTISCTVGIRMEPVS